MIPPAACPGERWLPNHSLTLRDRCRLAKRLAELIQRLQPQIEQASRVDDVTLGETTALGEPRAVILDTAKEWEADLIVLGSHGKRGVDRFLLGSVSEAVAIHAPCSVRVVRTKHAKGSSYAQ